MSVITTVLVAAALWQRGSTDSIPLFDDLGSGR